MTFTRRTFNQSDNRKSETLTLAWFTHLLNILIRLRYFSMCIYLSVNPAESACERSKILNGDIHLGRQLAKWVKFGWQLCYRASDDGWRGLDFHKKCDDVGPTVTLVKCGDNIFGGYTDQIWKNTTGIAF